MKLAFVFIISLFLAIPIFAKEAVLLDQNFDTADILGWRASGDLCVAPAFCAGQPEGNYWVAFSTNDSADPRTMCGSVSIRGLQTIFRSPDLLLPFKPSKFRVQFRVKFLTNEAVDSDLGNDQFTVRLLTRGGPVTILSVDDSGPSPESKNLKIEGSGEFHESNCSPDWKYETDFLDVTYYRTFHEAVRTKMMKGPVALEFGLTNGFDADFDSAVVLDNVKLVAYQ